MPESNTERASVPKFGTVRAFAPDYHPERSKMATHPPAPASFTADVWQPLCSSSAHHLFSLHRRRDWRIPCLRLQPLSPRLRLGPSTQRLHHSYLLHPLHHGSSVHLSHRAPWSLWLRLGLSLTISCLGTPLLWLRLVPLFLLLHLVPPTLRLVHWIDRGLPYRGSSCSIWFLLPFGSSTGLTAAFRIVAPPAQCPSCLLPDSFLHRLHPGNRPPPEPSPSSHQSLPLLFRRYDDAPAGRGAIHHAHGLSVCVFLPMCSL